MSFTPLRARCRSLQILSGLIVLVGLGSPAPSLAEWYVAGYGGWSAPNSLKDTRMDTLGLNRALQPNCVLPALGVECFPGAGTVPSSGTLTQTFRTSDLELKPSPFFGGKTGYFFSKEGFSWLGVEVEAFTSQPSIKNQTVTTTHDLTYIPNNPQPAGSCNLGIDCLAQQRLSGRLHVPESSLRLIAFAFNVVARYPGKIFQPYVGVGAGAFYFMGSGAIDGRQVVPGLNVLWGLKILPTPEWGIFIEGKYNRATITNFDSVYGLNGGYSAFNAVAGIAYHF